MGKIERVLVLPDTHIRNENGRIAGIDLKTHRAVLEYMKDHTWDEVIHLGDFMDFNCISSHNKGKAKLVEGQRIQKDYDAGNRILDDYQNMAPLAKFTIIEGNHDERIERYIEEHPETEGLLEMEKGLFFKERGVNWVRYWTKGEVYVKGKATFGHGRYTNEHHAKTHVNNYGTNFFYGHLHDFQCYSKVLMGDNSTLIGQSLGHLCERQGYMKGRPNRWQQGFCVFHFRPNGYFNYYPIMIFNHAFVSPEGKLYDGKKR